MKKPIRVLHVFGALNRGGAETMVMNLFRNIDRNKVQFDFVVHSLEEGAYAQEIRELGGRIFCIPRYKGKNHHAYIRAWKDLFQEHSEFKIIHGHLRSTASIYLKIAENYEIYTIAHSHSTSSRGNFIEKQVKNVLQLPIRNIAKSFIGCSAEAGEWLFGEKIVKSPNFFVLPNAIDVQQFIFDKNTRYRIRRNLNIDTSDLVLGHVGSFTEPKNHSYLIDIFKMIHDKTPNSKLILLGEGPLQTEIKKKVQYLSLENCVFFLGSQSNVNEYMQAMDVFVMPSKFEGLPVTLVEAQASGLPCVVPSHITEEVVITDLVHFVPQDSDLEDWVKTIRLSDKNKRIDQSNAVTEHGYNVCDSAKDMEIYYLKNYKHIMEKYK